MHKTFVLLAALAIIAAILACNLPGGAAGQTNPADIMTAAAQTIEAQLTAAAPTATFTSIAPLPSSTPFPTLPPAATPTSNCDAALFVTDVSFPDNTLVPAGTTFDKIWRLKNVGSCSWTPAYSVVFLSGESMGGPAVQALTGNVNPGQTIDLSVIMTAPFGNGIHTGYWILRNASGQTFHSQFYVQIKVQTVVPTNTLPPSASTVTLSSIGSETGSVRSDGTVLSTIPNVGDTETNVSSEVFVSFDMSSIPGGAVISQVVVDFSSYDMLGNPFTISDGCLRAYSQSYGTLSAGDYFPGDPMSALIRWCGTGDLNSSVAVPAMISYAQSKVGSSRLQLRLQFRVPTTNGNSVADMVRFGTMKLKITYH
jgi:Ig-like domain from next to BRCA1 gene